MTDILADCTNSPCCRDILCAHPNEKDDKDRRFVVSNLVRHMQRSMTAGKTADRWRIILRLLFGAR